MFTPVSPRPRPATNKLVVFLQRQLELEELGLDGVKSSLQDLLEHTFLAFEFTSTSAVVYLVASTAVRSLSILAFSLCVDTESEESDQWPSLFQRPTHKVRFSPRKECWQHSMTRPLTPTAIKANRMDKAARGRWRIQCTWENKYRL